MENSQSILSLNNFSFFAIVFCIFVVIPSVYAQDQVPDWVKNTAGWWADDTISDIEFINGIQFLVEESIIQVDIKSSSASSDVVPDWVKNTAGWWALDAISEKEFVTAIEFLISAGIINITSTLSSACDEKEDTDRNGIPDDIEDSIIQNQAMDESELKDLSEEAIKQQEFHKKNWSGCSFPINVSGYNFIDSDFSNADFSGATIFNTNFWASNLENADFSNAEMQGTSFFKSNLSYAKFTGVDFSTNSWEEPFLIFTYTIEKEDADGTYITRNFSCYYLPCEYNPAIQDNFENDFYEMTFGKNQVPLNLIHVDTIDEKNDHRSIWRHIPAFIASDMTGTIFTNADLSHAVFWDLTLTNVDFTNTNLSNVRFESVEFNDVKTIDSLLTGSIGPEGFVLPVDPELSIREYGFPENDFKVTQTPIDKDPNITFDSALDLVPINWSMGMTIYGERLYVADTDNHRIEIYDLRNNERLTTFYSPIQGIDPESLTEIRNLPTSIAIADQKIFVAYGFDDNIQVFDLGGNYLWKIGNSGTSVGEFNVPYRLSILNEELFVADSENNRIQVFDLDGNFLRQFEIKDKLQNKIMPHDISIHNDQIFVVDPNNPSILVFDLRGNLLKELKIDQNEENIIEPWGIFIIEKLIFVSDVGNFSVKIFDLNGNFIKQFGQYGDRYGEFKFPIDIITDPSLDRIFVSDAYNYTIQIFNIVK